MHTYYYSKSIHIDQRERERERCYHRDYFLPQSKLGMANSTQEDT